MSYTDKLLNKVRTLIEEYLKRWPEQIAREGGLPWNTMPTSDEEHPGFADAFHDHPQFYDARKIWGRDVENAIPDEGDGLVWDGEKWAVGPVGSGDGAGADFKAYLAADTDVDGVPGVPMTNVVYNRGDLYNAGTRTWTPPAGPVAFMFRTRLENNSGDINITITKNGSAAYSKAAGRYAVDGSAHVDGYWQDDANGTDQYQLAVYNVSASGDLLASDTFWSGMTGGTGGGGGAGGGGVPAPFVYLIDEDGAYLTDADGAYLYEAL